MNILNYPNKLSLINCPIKQRLCMIFAGRFNAVELEDLGGIKILDASSLTKAIRLKIGKI